MKRKKIFLTIGILTGTGILGYYFFMKSKKSAAANTSAIPANNQNNTIVAQNASDQQAINVINDIKENYDSLITNDDFIQAIERLNETAASGLTPIQCFVAPCPQPQKLSPAVMQAVNDLIAKLNADNQANNGYMFGGGR